jgi:hypothetical protein
VPAGRFVGTFHIHTYYVYLHADGRGSAQWPIDVRCGTGLGEGRLPQRATHSRSFVYRTWGACCGLNEH